jgi:type II secretory pathway component GspD/PulD (secretin)
MLRLHKSMKIENALAVIVAVLASCLMVSGQQQPPPQPPVNPSGNPNPNIVGASATPGSPNPAPIGANPVPLPEPMPPPLPEGRIVSYSPLTGGETISKEAPVVEGAVTDVTFSDVALTDAIRSLALQAGLNIIFDPNLLVAPDGHPIPPPQVTEKWRNLTAMQAMQALLDTWGWQLVWDSRTKVGRITKKDPAAKEPLVISVIQLRYSTPSNIVREVEGTLTPGSAIIRDDRTRQLIVRTTEKELFGVQALIAKLDSATRQVLVEARIVETSKDITSAKGVDWTGTLQSQHISFGNGLTQSSSSGGTSVNGGTGGSTVSPGGSTITGGSGVSTITSNITSFTSTVTGSTQQGGGFTLNTARGISPATAFLNADGVQAVLSFLNTDNDSKTIAFPRTVALDGVPTELAVVQNIPVFVQTQSAPAGGSASGLATIQPNYDLLVENTILNEVGVKLVVTPRIAGPTNVLLNLKPEISQQLPGFVSETLNGQVNQAPSFSRSRLVTEASVPSGYTLVLGGMDQDVVNKTFTKVPFFGDLPGLGNLFRSDSRSHSSETVLLFVTPTIISDSDYQLADSHFEKRKPASASAQTESAWNTGEPYDWTKPRKVSPDYQP